MNGAGGYVRSYRKLLGHPAFRNDGEAMAFNWLVLKAQWKPTRVRYKERIIILQRGQLAVSVRDMARSLERSRSWVERYLNRLKIETMIETRAETGVTIVTICNYSVYQADGQEAETPAKTPAKTPPRQGRDTEQEREESKEKDSPLNPPKGTSGTKTRLPTDWQPIPIPELSTEARKCAEKWPAGAYERAAEGFAHFWRGRGRMMVDWRATWAGWVIREHDKVMMQAERQDRHGEGKSSWKDAMIGARQ